MKKRNGFTKIGIVIGVVLILVSIFWFYNSPADQKMIQNTQDPWVVNIEDEPVGIFFFTFSSKGSITANRPIEVEIKFYYSNDLDINDFIPLYLVIPASFQYPLEPDPIGTTYSAGSVTLKQENDTGPFKGKAKIIFHQSGKFGYIVFSKGSPVYVRSLGDFSFSAVEVVPYSDWIVMYTINKGVSISLLLISLVIEFVVIFPLLGYDDKLKLPTKSKIVYTLVITIVFAISVYLVGVTYFNLNDTQGFTLVVGISVTLFIGLLKIFEDSRRK